MSEAASEANLQPSDLRNAALANAQPQIVPAATLSPAGSSANPKNKPEKGGAAKGGDRTQVWQKIAWARATTFLGIVGIMLCLLVLVTMYQMGNIVASEQRDPYFVFAGMTLLIITLLRFLAILVGGGAVFAGLAVSFFTHERAIELEAGVVSSAKGKLATSSPGIAAIVVGAIVIIAALYSKGDYEYSPPIRVPVTYGLVKDPRPSGSPVTPASAPISPQAASQPIIPSAAQVIQDLRSQE